MKKEIVLDLGVASAYGDAVAAGYTGTKEEFSEMLANLRTYHDEAVSAGDSAIDAAMRATSAVETIQEIADDAEQSKTDAAASATAAEQSAQAAADTLAQLTTDTTLTITGKPADAAATGQAVTELKRDFAGIPIEVSGNPIAISDSAGAVPARSLVLNLVPHQEGSGDPSPSNVRAISGYTAVNVTRAGKNLLPMTMPDTFTKSGVTATRNADGSITLNGTATANANFEICGSSGSLQSIALNGPVTLSGCPSGGSTATYRLVLYYYKNGTYSGFVPDVGAGRTQEVDCDQAYAIISVYSGQTYNNLTFYPQLELGSTKTTYEPYIESAVYPITLPTDAGTVYGGTLNPQTGELTVDRAMKTFNGSEAWNFYQFSTATGQYRAYVAINDIDTSVADSVIAPWLLSNIYNTIKYGTGATETGVATRYGIAQVNIFQSEYNTVESLKAFLAENNLQIAYKLATPITYQLTPAQVELLKGSNTLWIDADGTIDLTYNGDIKTYIDSKVAELQALILENNG